MISGVFSRIPHSVEELEAAAWAVAPGAVLNVFVVGPRGHHLQRHFCMWWLGLERRWASLLMKAECLQISFVLLCCTG